MKHGDISNHESPIVAFNLDNLLFLGEKSNKSVFSRVSNIFRGEESKFFNREINQIFIQDLNILWNSRGYSIYLVTYSPARVRKYEKVLYDNQVCYTRVLAFDMVEDAQLFIRNRCMLYIDRSNEMLSVLNSNNCIAYKDMWTVMGGRR